VTYWYIYKYVSGIEYAYVCIWELFVCEEMGWRDLAGVEDGVKEGA